MEFDMYFLRSYLHRNFLVTPDEVKLSSNLKKDFGLNHTDITGLLEYLENMHKVIFPHKNAIDQYEYVFDIYLYFLLNNHNKNNEIRH